MLIIDHGPGIAPDQRERVFEPFQRLGDRRAGGGVGLGLAVAKGFIEAVGGRISADVHARRWPHDARRAVCLGTAAPHAANASSVTSVLVIDDDAAACCVLCGSTSRPATTRSAPHPTAARVWRRWHGSDRTWSIVDLGLPDMDGTDVIRGVRGWSSAPIIVLSARGQEPQKVAALDAGADDYVTKPFGMDELLARLRAAIRRGTLRPATTSRPSRPTHFTVDLAAKRVVLASRSRRPADADRVAAAGDAGPQPRPPGHRAAAATGRVGPGVRDRDALPAGVRGAVAPQAGARSVPTAVPAHRTGDGLPDVRRLEAAVRHPKARRRR